MGKPIERVPIEPVKHVAKSKWTYEQIIGTRIGKGGKREQARTGIDRIRYNGEPVGNCARKPGNFVHLTHPPEDLSESDIADLKRLLADRDAARFNKLYRKINEPSKTAADFLERQVILAETLDPDTMD